MTKLEAYAPPAAAAQPLSPEALAASLREALTPWKAGAPFWVFGYGSLMWNPQFTWDARHVGAIRGYHRAFRVWSRINRGTPERPGLVLTLERGGSCRGLLYRIPADRVHEEMEVIWRREMTFGSYRPKWLDCVVGSERINALAFTVNRDCSGYTGQIPLEVVVEAIASAHGRYGPACDYLFKTMETLHAHGIRDSRVEQLVQLVRARMRAD
jgi:glutathione-specific gamma-glutamylcyclotransferase